MNFVKQNSRMKLYFLFTSILIILFIKSVQTGFEKFTAHFKVSSCSTSIVSTKSDNCNKAKNMPPCSWEIKWAF
jgi:hypothetical protein